MVITAAHSRVMVARMIPTQQTQDLLLGMWELLQQVGRVPRLLVWDNESGIGRGKRHAEGVGAFAGTLATTLQRLKPYDPESKGVVERRNGFFETVQVRSNGTEASLSFLTQAKRPRTSLLVQRLARIHNPLRLQSSRCHFAPHTVMRSATYCERGAAVVPRTISFGRVTTVLGLRVG